MLLSNIFSTTAALLLMLGKSQAKAVFAHYMVRVYHHVAAAYDEVHMN